jgi:hypothetical protein
MEGAPRTDQYESVESDSPDELSFGDAESGRKKKKKAKNQSSLIVSSAERDTERSSKTETNKERDSLWQRLIGDEDKPKEDARSNADTSDRQEDTEIITDQPEMLSPEEILLVTQQLVQSRKKEQAYIDREPTPGGYEVSPDSDLAAIAIEEFHDRILMADETVDQAAATVLGELGAEIPLQASTTSEAGYIPEQAEAIIADEELPEATSANINEPPIARPNMPRTPEGSASFPGGPGFFEGGPITPGGFGLGGKAPETATASPAAEQMIGYNKSDVIGAALVGGLVGYLVGRRRGRIKTEKRLLPVQKKLETQVKNLKQNIERQEFTIRQAASERYSQRAAEVSDRGREKAAFISRIDSIKEQSKRSIEKVRPARETRAEQTQIGQVLISAAESLSSTGVETAGARLAAKPQSAEAPPQERTRPAAVIEKAPVVPIDRHVETLNQKDLLELSSKIVIDGTSLRQVFEEHQVGEKALRRVISEHLRGGDVRQALRAELTQHEIDFERDPQMRDRSHQSQTASTNGGGALQALIQRADATVGREDGEERAVLEARAAHQTKEQAQVQHQQRLINLSLISIISVLLALVVLLIVTRSP